MVQGCPLDFVGREYRIEVGSTEQFIDMLFYNIILHCYVVIEVKVEEFQPRDMGQIQILKKMDFKPQQMIPA